MIFLKARKKLKYIPQDLRKGLNGLYLKSVLITSSFSSKLIYAWKSIENNIVDTEERLITFLTTFYEYFHFLKKKYFNFQ